MNDVRIRKGTRDDCWQIQQLFQSLLESEKIVPDQIIDEKSLMKNGFGSKPVFETLVAEIEDSTGNADIVGFAMYFYHYSVFAGRAAFVEAIYVEPRHQNKGIGKRLWKSVVQTGLDEDCHRCIFHVFGWNDKAVQFYKKCGAVDFTSEKDEHVFHMTKEDMVRFTSS